MKKSCIDVKSERYEKAKYKKKTKTRCLFVTPPRSFHFHEFVSLDYISLYLPICNIMKTEIVSLFGVTDFLAAVRTIIFVVITALRNIGGPPRNHSFSNGRRPPLLENGRFPACRHWSDDFPFRSPRALRPVVRLSRYIARPLFRLFTFRAFRVIFFSTFRYYRFYDHGRKRHIKYDIIFCLSKSICCSPIPTLYAV